MKKIMVLIALSMMSSCRNDSSGIEKPYMDLCLIRDRTDPHQLHPDAMSILRLFNLSDEKDACVNFRYCEITDKTLVPIVNLILPFGTTKRKNNNEPLFRERLILNFYDTIIKTLASLNINNDSSFLDHSEVFRTIASELFILSQSNSQHKILLVFSNLYENSDILSVYEEATKETLMKTPEKIRDQFEKYNLLPQDLSNIKIVFLFNPATRKEDQNYMRMIQVYKLLLEPKGAVISIQASNTYFN